MGGFLFSFDCCCIDTQVRLFSIKVFVAFDRSIIAYTEIPRVTLATITSEQTASNINHINKTKDTSQQFGKKSINASVSHIVLGFSLKLLPIIYKTSTSWATNLP